MSTFKCVIFDMGGVLVRFKHYDKFMEFVAAAKDDVEKREKFMAFEKGEISAEELLGLLDEIFKPEVDLDNLEAAVFEKFMGPKDNDIFTAIEKLKENGIKVGLLTNNGYWTPLKQRSTILEGCYELFDAVIESCRVGLRKPDPEIYKMMLDKLNAHPNEAIFIDDLDSNVKAAEKLGITGITLADQNSKLVVEKLEKLLNLKLS